MNETCASRLRNVDLDIAPASFSLERMDRTELSCYVLEDVLGCPVGCQLDVCIQADPDADANGTKVSYSDQTKLISASTKECSIKTKSWKMSGKQYILMQGCIVQATLHDKLVSKMLSWSRFKCYYKNRSGNIGVVFDRSSAILSVLWQNIINYSHIIMFFGKQFDQSFLFGPVFRFKTDPEYAHHVFRQFASENFGDSCASSQLFAPYKDCLCNVYRAIAKSSSTDRPSKLPNFNGEGAEMFFAQFDNLLSFFSIFFHKLQ